MEKIRDQRTGKVIGVVMYATELAHELECSTDELESWGELIVPSGTRDHPRRDLPEAFYELTLPELDRCRQLTAIIRTGMTPAQVGELVARDKTAREAGKPSNSVEMYARLAEDCPAGITAHAMRSYCCVLLAQNRHGRAMMAEDLAVALSIPRTTATRHLRYLQRVGLMKLNREEGRWEAFKLVPRALSKNMPD